METEIRPKVDMLYSLALSAISTKTDHISSKVIFKFDYMLICLCLFDFKSKNISQVCVEAMRIKVNGLNVGALKSNRFSIQDLPIHGLLTVNLKPRIRLVNGFVIEHGVTNFFL